MRGNGRVDKQLLVKIQKFRKNKKWMNNEVKNRLILGKKTLKEKGSTRIKAAMSFKILLPSGRDF